LGLSLVTAGQHRAFADAATEAQLRAALQTATAQIAQLEDQVANLQASQAPDVATIEALRAQLQAGKTGPAAGAGAESAADKAKNDAAMAALKRQLEAQAHNLDKSQTAYLAASNAASSAGQENAALKAELAALNAGLGSCRQKNAQLFTLGNQILDAYSHKDDLFGAIADREPFTGIKRVQLQNIVQDDQDKLYDNQITPPASAP
jgi:chromosome segregation ATPase